MYFCSNGGEMIRIQNFFFDCVVVLAVILLIVPIELFDWLRYKMRFKPARFVYHVDAEAEIDLWANAQPATKTGVNWKREGF
jgi:hypothetical protein